MGNMSGPQWRGFGVVQKVFGLRTVPGPKLITAADQKRKTRRNREHVENNPQTRRRKGARQECERVDT